MMSIMSMSRYILASPSSTMMEVHGWRFLSVMVGSDMGSTSSRRHMTDDSLLPQVNVLLALGSSAAEFKPIMVTGYNHWSP
jgi:hypothetical protein